jgi:uncharacterized membrane-anchored protein
MNTRIKVALLAVLSVLQLAATASSIARYESTLRTGALYRIRTEPVDPADAFRGRYVAVQPTIGLTAPLPAPTHEVVQRVQAGEKGYVVLGADADGFAIAAAIRADPPSQGDYLEIKSAWDQWTRESEPGGRSRRTGYNLTFSFDRYYMNAAKAPQAERRYADAARRDPVTRAWVNVRVRNGVGVIEGLYVDGVPIEEAVAPPPK